MMIFSIVFSLFGLSLSILSNNGMELSITLFAENLTKITAEVQHLDPLLLHGDICVVTTEESNHLWNELITEYAKGVSLLYSPIVFTTMEDFPFLERRCLIYLIQLNSSEGPAKVLKNIALLPRLSSWNRFGKFIFITIESASFELKPVLSTYCNLVIYLGVANSVQLLYEADTARVQLIVMNYFRRVVKCHQGGLDLVATILTRDHVTDLGGYPFNVAISEYKPLIAFHGSSIFGATPMAILSFCIKVNASCVWLKCNTRDAMLLLARRDRINLFPHSNITAATPVELLFLPIVNGYCLLIPEQAISYFNHLMKPFDNNLWFFLLMIGVVCMIANRYLSQLYPRNILVTTIFGTPVAGQRMRHIERFTLCAVSVIFFILCQGYLAKMITFMGATKYESHIETIDEFVQAKIPLWMPNYNKKSVSNVLPEALVSSVVGTVPEGHAFVGSVPKGHAYVRTCLEAEVFRTHPDNVDKSTNRFIYYLLKEWLYVGRTAHSVSRRDPFGEKFSDINAQLFESGLWQVMFRKTRLLFSSVKTIGRSLLSFEDLISLWLILAYGLLGSGIVFIGELLYDLAQNKSLLCVERIFRQIDFFYIYFWTFIFLIWNKFRFVCRLLMYYSHIRKQL